MATEIPLPPLVEQRRLVARIDALAAKIDEAKRLREAADKSISTLWHRSLGTVFSDLSASEKGAMFGEVCRVVRGGSPRPAGSPEFYDGDIPFLKVGDLTSDDETFISIYTFTIKEAGLLRSRWVEANTLMLTNSGATLGVPKICTFGTTFNDGIQAFLDLPSSLNKEFLYYFLRSKTIWFREWAARGQGQPNLNTEMVKRMSFPWPCLEIQSSIVLYFKRMRQRLNDFNSNIQIANLKLDALLPSILDRAFRGEL